MAVVVRCRGEFPGTPAAFRERFLEVERWPDFRGYGPIPGIASARLLERTPDLVGTRIEVINDDGSRHVEQVVEASDQVFSLRMSEFSPPLAHLATHFVETLRFEPGEGGRTQVERSMALHPRRAWARPVLWLIGRFLRRALERHLQSEAFRMESPA